MPTSKPLLELVPEIVNHIERHRDHLQFNLRLYNMYEGQIRQEIEDSLRAEMVSTAAFNRASKRIPSLNILKKGTDKLSVVYNTRPIRKTANAQDQKLLEDVVRESAFNGVMCNSNIILNLQHMGAIEPFIEDGKPRMRVLTGHQFLPFSDDKKNPSKMTVAIKLLGSEQRIIKQREYTSDKGEVNTDDEKIHLVDIFALYSDDSFLIIDDTGTVQDKKMAEAGAANGKNPFGIIPFFYLNKSRFQLVPFPNQPGFDISILIPKLLTDLNYAAQFQSHSILWTRNADISGAEVHPDAIVNLGDTQEGQGDPEMGSVNPQVDIEKVLQLIEFELSAYFSSIGIKTTGLGSMMPGREASGVAKMMDQGDTSEAGAKQIEFFKDLERQLWDWYAKLHNASVKGGNLPGVAKFTDSFASSFSISFDPVKPLESAKQKIERVKLLREAKLASREQAIKIINPDFTDAEVEEWIASLDAEREQNMTFMMGDAPGAVDPLEKPVQNQAQRSGHSHSLPDGRKTGTTESQTGEQHDHTLPDGGRTGQAPGGPGHTHSTPDGDTGGPGA